MYRNEKKCRCQNQSGTEIRDPVRYRTEMPECRWHQPWCCYILKIGNKSKNIRYQVNLLNFIPSTDPDLGQPSQCGHGCTSLVETYRYWMRNIILFVRLRPTQLVSNIFKNSYFIPNTLLITRVSEITPKSVHDLARTRIFFILNSNAD